MITQEELSERIINGAFGAFSHSDRFIVEEDLWSHENDAEENQNGSNFEDRSDSLEHYGVLGMKWGIRKDRYAKGQNVKRRDRRYEGESDEDYQKRMARESAERIAKTQAKAALKAQKNQIKQQERKEKELRKEKVDAEKRQIKEREDSQKRMLKSQEKIASAQLKSQQKKEAEQRKAQVKKEAEERKLKEQQAKDQAKANKKEKSKQKTESNFEKGKKAKDSSKMTDQEVYDAIARMKLDQEYKRLAQKQKGILRSTAESTLVKVGANVVYTQLSKYGNTAFGAAEKKVLTKIAENKAKKQGKETSNPSNKEAQDAVNHVLAQMAYYQAMANAKERSKDVNHSDNQNGSYLVHYGVLGMKWGIRKDEDMSDFIGPMPKWEVNDMNITDYISERGGLYSGDTGIVGRFHYPGDYQGQQRENENTGVTDLGMKVAFDHDAWNSAEERDRLGVIDYGLIGGCKAMNGLLRGDMEKAQEGADSINYSMDDVRRSINGMTKILNNTHTTRDMITDKRLPQSALASLFGVDADILKDRSAVGELIGSRIMDEGFFSTSMIADAKTASNYGDVKLHTYIPEGSQAIYMEEPMCLNPSQKGQDGYRNVYRKSWTRALYEVCLNRGSEFKIAGITMDDDDNITDVYLDLIGQHGKGY